MKAQRTLNTKLFPGVTLNQLQKALRGEGKRLRGLRKDTDVLTEKEQLQLVDWIKACAHGKDPATNEQISEKVVVMLKARRAENKRRKYGKGTIALTTAEDRLATTSGAEVSITWLTNFAANHPDVRPMKERNADATRTKKQNEGVVEKHFHGQYGVQASLESIDLIDMATKMIIDPRRVWWFDEMPQVLDAANQGPRGKAWGVAGEILERAGSVNRETGSVGLWFNLAGFLGGPQFNVGRENWSCALAQIEAPPWAKSFDNQIYTLDAKSTYAAMAKTANGVQTAASFMAFLRAVRTQVDAYSAAEVAAGRPPIEFPIWMGTDNHSSRFSAEVLEACTPAAANELGIRLFFEEAKTSQFLQPPDQITKLVHGAYTRGKKRYQKLHEKVYGEKATITIVEFIEIWGGCKALGYEGAWFSWCDAQILLDAWRRCGWLGCLIAPEEIDRSSFIDQPTAPQPPPDAPTPIALTYEQALVVPEGMRAGSLAAAQAQVEALKAYIEANTHAPFDAVAAGLLEPKVAEPKKRVRDKTRIDESEGGDAFLRDLAGNARAKQVRREEEAAGVQARKEARVAAAAAAAAEAKAQREAYDRCKPMCRCGVKPCPQAKLILCATCGDIKGNVCRKAVCVAAAQPLMLTMREEPAPLALPAPP